MNKTMTFPPICVALVNARDAYLRTASDYSKPRDRSTVRKQCEAITALIRRLAVEPVPSSLADDVLREEWRAAGGRVHGPFVETVYMPEERYFEFRRGLAAIDAPDSKR